MKKILTGFILSAAMLANTAVGALAYNSEGSINERSLPTGDLSIPKSLRIDLPDDVSLFDVSEIQNYATEDRSEEQHASGGGGSSSSGSGGGTAEVKESPLYSMLPEDGHGYGYEYLAEFGNGAVMQKCYDDMVQMCREYANNEDDNENYILVYDEETKQDVQMIAIYNTENIPYTYHLTSDETEIAFYAFRQDHPEFWWLNKDYVGGSGKDENDMQISFPVPTIYEDYARGSYRQGLDGIIKSKLKDYLNKINALEEKDSYSIAKFVHDEICSNVKYGWDTNGKPLEDAYAHNIVGVLDGDETTDPVCESYAKAYQLIMTAAGQDCRFVAGWADADHDGKMDLKNEGHGWNLVKLKEDTYYYVDLTWDDVDEESGSTVVDGYFAKGSNTYKVDHKVFTPDMFLSKEEVEGLDPDQQWLKCTGKFKAYFMPVFRDISDVDYDDGYDVISIEYINIQTDLDGKEKTVPGISVSVEEQTNNAKLFVVSYNEDDTVRKISVKDLDNEKWNTPYIGRIEDFTSPSKIKAFLWGEKIKPLAKSKGIVWTPHEINAN